MDDEVPVELTCYLHAGWAPCIRPAGRNRDWMDESPERFAYRCLPLATANAHGWEVASACGFAARWNGQTGVDAIEIGLDPQADPQRAPVSLFGEGILTFHIEGLLRTSPGWNLWVGGPPNAFKDGIAPLTGFVETDWSPYTFTMNWRFSRPGHWVRWEEDEPFCFFFPVQRSVIERVKPVFVPIDAEPELAAAFAAWSASRSAFQEEVSRHPPVAPTDKWQKLYYRGAMPDGQRPARDHQSKLQLCPFRPISPGA